MKYTPQQFAEHGVFRWRDGMRSLQSERFYWCVDKFVDHNGFDYAVEYRFHTPDLGDPATLRLLLEIIREHTSPKTSVYFDGDTWCVQIYGPQEFSVFGECESDALFEALNAILKERKKCKSVSK